MYLNSGEDEKPGSVQQVAVVTDDLQQSVSALQVLHCDLETNEVKDPDIISQACYATCIYQH